MDESPGKLEEEAEHGDNDDDGDVELDWPSLTMEEIDEEMDRFESRATQVIREDKVYRTNPDAPDRHMTKARGRWYRQRLAQKRTWYNWQREARVLSTSPRTEGFLLGPESEEKMDFVSRRDSLIGKQ